MWYVRSWKGLDSRLSSITIVDTNKLTHEVTIKMCRETSEMCKSVIYSTFCFRNSHWWNQSEFHGGMYLWENLIYDGIVLRRTIAMFSKVWYGVWPRNTVYSRTYDHKSWKCMEIQRHTYAHQSYIILYSSMLIHIDLCLDRSPIIYLEL